MRRKLEGHDGELQTFHPCISWWFCSYTSSWSAGSIRYDNLNSWIYHWSANQIAAVLFCLYVSGFISIACGSPANSNYSEPTTGTNYISDAAFIDTGISQQISAVYKGGFQQHVWNLRSFPQGIWNCYNISITQGNKYLIWGTFFYGNYDGQSKLPQFDIHLGVNMWDTVNITNVTIPVIKELIHVPSQTNLQVCLVNTGLGMPFISAIELRPLSNKTYETNFGSLALFARLDVGSSISYRWVIYLYIYIYIYITKF